MSDVHFDFATLLTLLTLITGAVWALDKLWLAPRRRAAGLGTVVREAGGLEKAAAVVTGPLRSDVDDGANAFVDFCRSFFPVIALVLLLRSFIVEPFRIPSGSMIPTLSIGDFILVNKFTYGLRDPVFHTRFLQLNQPQRGDIVVFRWPVDPRKDFIKRIVGLPGDRIAYRDKVLSVNGEAAAQQPDGIYTGPYGEIYRFREQLGEVGHSIIVNPARPSDDFEFTVPPGEYFAMGDNRDGSDDSRRWGTLPERNLVGRAFFIWMSWDGANLRVDFSRIGTRLK